MKRPLILFFMGTMISSSFLQAAAAVQAPVVVELFESQGCSSCPPSERVMSRLKQEFGDSVILLTFHVDYWDYLGWKDVFSDVRYTERQKMYGHAFAQDSIYTPEMVVGGESGFNGSDINQAVAEVRSRLSAASPSLQLVMSPKTSKTSDFSVQLPPELAKGARELLAVIVEDAPPVQVLRGENRGETMTGNFAVRSIKEIPLSGESRSHIALTLPSGADPARTRVAVLARGDSPKILSSQSIPWSSKVESKSTPRRDL